MGWTGGRKRNDNTNNIVQGWQVLNVLSMIINIKNSFVSADSLYYLSDFDMGPTLE